MTIKIIAPWRTKHKRNFTEKLKPLIDFFQLDRLEVEIQYPGIIQRLYGDVWWNYNFVKEGRIITLMIKTPVDLNLAQLTEHFWLPIKLHTDLVGGIY